MGWREASEALLDVKDDLYASGVGNHFGGQGAVLRGVGRWRGTGGGVKRAAKCKGQGGGGLGLALLPTLHCRFSPNVLLVLRAPSAHLSDVQLS
jgi:hypothetical protein